MIGVDAPKNFPLVKKKFLKAVRTYDKNGISTLVITAQLKEAGDDHLSMFEYF